MNSTELLQKIVNPHLGTYFGVPLYAHWSWVMMMVMMLFLNPLATALFLAVFLFVVMHEYRHILAAKSQGIQVDRVVLYPIGGVAAIEIGPDDPRKEFIVTVMGPMVNVVLAVLCSGLVLVFVELNWMVAAQVAFWFAYINVMLFVFNLAPAYPMDGGRIFRSILGRFMDYQKANWWAVRVGQVTCLLLFLYALATGLWMMALIMPLVALLAQSEINRVENHAEFRRLRKVFVLASLGRYAEAEAAVPATKASLHVNLLRTLEICKNTPGADFGPLLAVLGRAYPDPHLVATEIGGLELACLRRQNHDLDAVLNAVEANKPIEEIERIVEAMTDQDFKARCKQALSEAREKAASSCE